MGVERFFRGVGRRLYSGRLGRARTLLVNVNNNTYPGEERSPFTNALCTDNGAEFTQ